MIRMDSRREGTPHDTGMAPSPIEVTSDQSHATIGSRCKPIWTHWLFPVPGVHAEDEPVDSATISTDTAILALSEPWLQRVLPFPNGNCVRVLPCNGLSATGFRGREA